MFVPSTEISAVFVLVLWKKGCLAKARMCGRFLSSRQGQWLHGCPISVEIFATVFRTRHFVFVALLINGLVRNHRPWKTVTGGTASASRSCNWKVRMGELPHPLGK